MKVFYLSNQPAPYRVKFWNQLGKLCDLTVAFETFTESNRDWQVSGVGENFKPIFMPGLTLATQFHYNPSIKKHLREYKYDIYVISGYCSPTDMMAITELGLQDKNFIFSADGGFPKSDERKASVNMKRKYIGAGKWFMSSGSVCDEYLMAYGVRKENIYRYNFSSVSERDFDDVTPMTDARRKGLLKRYGLKDNVIITAGQFINRKGYDLLLDMWKHVRLDNTSLFIVGGGPKEKQYRKMIKDFNIKNVVLSDFMPKERLFDMYRISKLFVFPTRYDIWGLTPGEAMACGLPVISSYNAASIHDLVGHEYNGYVENLYEPITWARRMEEMIKDDKTRKLFSQRSIKKMKDYTIESMVKSYYDLFKKIMREKK